MKRSPLGMLLILALAIGALAGGCQDSDDEIGTPCNSVDDCSSDLICDIHDGLGTCQVAHDH